MKFRLIEDIDENYNLKSITDKVAAEVAKYDENDSNQNCLLATWATELQLRGEDFLPRPVYSPRDPIFNIEGEQLIKNPERLKIKDKQDVEDKVKAAGNGARFYCHVNWAGSKGGHEFLVINDNNNVLVVDGQVSHIEDIQKDDTYFNDINFENSYIVRLDNKKINQDVLKLNDEDQIVEWDDELDMAFLNAQEDEITEGLEKITYKPVEDVEQFKTYANKILGGDGNMSAADIQNSIKEIYIDNELVGYIGFSEYEEDDVKMLGIGNFMTIQQGKGHGTKIINDIVETKKNEYDLIYCFVDADNAGAIRLYKKLGTVYDEDGPNDNGQYYVTFYDNGKFDLDEDYDPPYNEEQIKANYGDETYQRLIDDPAHAWRMKTGLELVHKEPSKKELERIWANWQEMTDEQKAESDKKSIELFGKTNEENYNELIKLYESVEKDNKDLNSYIRFEVLDENGINQGGLFRGLNNLLKDLWEQDAWEYDDLNYPLSELESLTPYPENLSDKRIKFAYTRKFVNEHQELFADIEYVLNNLGWELDTISISDPSNIIYEDNTQIAYM